ncbi:MAG: hypothetical protein KF891_25325 [Rhizobacter sp.]|nr:hypothetical protein [Rhizobacter sp.]
MNAKLRTLAWAAPLAAAVAWAAISWLAPADAPGPGAPAPVYTDWQFNPYAKGAPLPAVQHNADAARAAEAAHERVQQVIAHGSLRDTDADGDWGRWAGGQLQPSFSLRQRFDYLLTTLGEATPADLRQWVDEEVTAQKGAAAARQVLAVWDRYIALQQHAFRLQANPADPASWQPALAERVSVRQQILGRDWAQAFYAEEEKALLAHAEAMSSPAGRDDKTPPEGDVMALLTAPADAALAEQVQARRVQQLGPEAAERLRAEDAAWADWERRLQAARLRLQAIVVAPELSAPQRRQAQDDALAQAFSGQELVRARALLLDHG